MNIVPFVPPVLIEVEWVEEEPVLREGQPCWCPDAFLDNHLHVTYCPCHGSHPDPELCNPEETIDA